MWPFSRSSERREESAPSPVVENTIAAGSNVRGDLRGASFRVDGTVEGAVEAEGAVVIGEGGAIHGFVTAKDVIVYGSIRGDVTANHLEIGPRGKIAGDVTVESFRMHKGGAFLGMSRMPGAEELAQVAIAALPPAPSSSPSLGDSSRGSKVPAAAESTRFEAAPRGRTLPPPKGAVLPPPAPGSPTPPPLTESQERISAPAVAEPKATASSAPAAKTTSEAPRETSSPAAATPAAKSDPPDQAASKRAAAAR